MHEGFERVTGAGSVPERCLCSSGAVEHSGLVENSLVGEWDPVHEYRECEGSVLELQTLLILSISAFGFNGQSCLFCLGEGSCIESPMALCPGRVGSCQCYLG